MIDRCPRDGDWRHEGNCHTCITREHREARRIAQAERDAQQLHVTVMAAINQQKEVA